MIRTASVLVLLILCCAALSSSAESLGALQVGADFFTDGRTLEHSGTTYRLDSHYLTVAFVLPISIPKVDSHLRLAFGHGSGRNTATLERQSYISSRNEFLVGKKYALGESRFHLLPQVGLGLQIEGVFPDWPNGVGFVSGYADLTTTLGYSFDEFGVGLMASYQQGVYVPDDENNLTKRFGLAMVIWK